MTKSQIKNNVDSQIGEKIMPNTITPIDVAKNLKDTIDIIPEKVVINMGIISTTDSLVITAPTNTDSFLTKFLVDFTIPNHPNVSTLLPLVVKAGDTVIVTSSTYYILTKDAVPVEDASLTVSGKVNIVDQKFKGNKAFRLRTNGATSSTIPVCGFSVEDTLGNVIFTILDNGRTVIGGKDFANELLNILGSIRCNKIKSVGINTNGMVFLAGNLDINQSLIYGTLTEVVLRSLFNNNYALSLNNLTGNVTIGLETNQTGVAKLEVVSQDRGAIPFPKMTYAQRMAILPANLTSGLHVYQTNAVSPDLEGVYVYKSTNVWVFAY